MNAHPIDAEERLRFWEAKKKRLLREIEDATAGVENQEVVVEADPGRDRAHSEPARCSITETGEIARRNGRLKAELLLVPPKVSALA